MYETVFGCNYYCVWYIYIFNLKYVLRLPMLVELKAMTDKATRHVIEEQKEMGIDVVTDGEVTRENYLYSFW